MSDEKSWIVGAVEPWTDLTFTVGGAQTIAASAGALYLYHGTTAALSLLAQVEAAMDAGSITGAVAALQTDRLVRLSGTGGNWSGTLDATLASLLGFASGSLSGASSYVADVPSPLLWAPGRRYNPGTGLLGSGGWRHYGTTAHVAEDGTVTSSTQGSTKVLERFRWAHIPLARYWDSSRSNQTLEAFFEVYLQHRAWRHYLADEDDTSSSLATLTEGTGPWRRIKGPGTIPVKRAKGAKSYEARYDYEVEAMIALEYTA